MVAGTDSGTFDYFTEAVVGKALLDHNPHPTHQEIVDALAGNVCRCTGYLPIITAIDQAAQASGK